MSKKSRKAKTKFRNETFAKQANIRQTSAKPAIESRSSISSMTQVKTAAAAVKANQFDYFLPDLRNIGIISGILVIILIVLTFILG